MSTVTCGYCGLPFRVHRVEAGRDYYCCTGCSLLARVPVDSSGNYPVNAPLVSALTVGFLYFNQLLAWAVSVLLSREGKLVSSERFAWIAMGAALIVWVSVMVLQRRGGSIRGKDWVLAALTFAFLLTSLRSLPPEPALAAAANAVLIAWNLRGVLRKRTGKTPG